MEQRRTQRYRLQLPLRILQLGEQRVNRTERTRNISSGGVCFVSPTSVDVGTRIEYIITLSGNKVPVHLHCLGKVLRSSQPSASKNGEFEVALTIERYQFERIGTAEAARA